MYLLLGGAFVHVVLFLPFLLSQIVFVSSLFSFFLEPGIFLLYLVSSHVFNLFVFLMNEVDNVSKKISLHIKCHKRLSFICVVGILHMQLAVFISDMGGSCFGSNPLHT